VQRARSNSRPVSVHHVRAGTGGGTGLKPGDEWAVPLCADHHHAGHTVGLSAIGVDRLPPVILNEVLCRVSPFGPGRMSV
jgi:hypothetical protein